MSNIKYKLVTADYKTRPGYKNETLWEFGKLVTAENLGGVPKPCSNSVIHYYHSPIQAALFSPLHLSSIHTKLLQIKIDNELGTDGLKGWCSGAIPLRETALPVLSYAFRVEVEFAIRCALEVYSDPQFVGWANGWLSGADRSYNTAAHAAARVAEAIAKTNIDFEKIISEVKNTLITKTEKPMSFCRWGCKTGFNSVVEREDHENHCPSAPAIVRYLGRTGPRTRRIDDILYRFAPMPLINGDTPLWQQCRIDEWFTDYGWDEIKHPTSKKELLRRFKDLTNKEEFDNVFTRQKS